MSAFVSTDPRENMIRAYKCSGCLHCGLRYPDVDWSGLHVAHLDPNDRTPLRFSLDRSSYETILTELLKCICLCHSCHNKFDHHTPITEIQMPLFSGTGDAWHLHPLKVAS